MSEASSTLMFLYVDGIVAGATGKKVAVAVWTAGSVRFVKLLSSKVIGLLGRFLLGDVRFV